MEGSVKSDMYKKYYSAIKTILQKHAYWIEKDTHDILKGSFLFFKSHIQAHPQGFSQKRTHIKGP